MNARNDIRLGPLTVTATGSVWTRVFALAQLTVKEALHTRLLLAVSAIALVAIVYMSGAAGVDSAAQMTVVRRGVVTVIAAFTSFVLVFQAAFTVPQDVESRRIYSLLAKPLPRAGVLLGRWCGHVLTALLLFVVFGVAGYIVIAISGRDLPAAAQASTPAIEATYSEAWGRHTTGSRVYQNQTVETVQLRDQHEGGMLFHFNELGGHLRQPIHPAQLALDPGALSALAIGTLDVGTHRGTRTIELPKPVTANALASALSTEDVARALGLDVHVSLGTVVVQTRDLGATAWLTMRATDVDLSGAIRVTDPRVIDDPTAIGLPPAPAVDSVTAAGSGVRAQGRDGIIAQFRAGAIFLRTVPRRIADYIELTLINPDAPKAPIERAVAIKDRGTIEFEVPESAISESGYLTISVAVRDLPLVLVLDPRSVVILEPPAFAPFAYFKALMESFGQVLFLLSFVTACTSVFTPFTGVIAGVFAWIIGGSVGGLRQAVNEFLETAAHSQRMAEASNRVADPYGQAGASLLEGPFGEAMVWLAEHAPDFYRFGVAETFVTGYDAPLAVCAGALWYYVAWSLGCMAIACMMFTFRDVT